MNRDRQPLGREALVNLLLRELERESPQRYKLVSYSWASDGKTQWELEAPGSSQWRRIQLPLAPELADELQTVWPLHEEAYRGNKPQGPRQILTMLGFSKKVVDEKVRERQAAETAAMRRIRRKNVRDSFFRALEGNYGHRENLAAIHDLFQDDPETARLAAAANQALAELANRLRALPEDGQ